MRHALQPGEGLAALLKVTVVEGSQANQAVYVFWLQHILIPTAAANLSQPQQPTSYLQQ